MTPIPSKNPRHRVILMAAVTIGVTLAVLGSILQAAQNSSGPFIRGTGLMILLISGVTFVASTTGKRWQTKINKTGSQKTNRRSQRSAGVLIFVARVLGWLLIVGGLLQIITAGMSFGWRGTSGFFAITFWLYGMLFPLLAVSCGVLLLCAAEIINRLLRLEQQTGNPPSDGSSKADQTQSPAACR